MKYINGVYIEQANVNSRATFTKVSINKNISKDLTPFLDTDAIKLVKYGKKFDVISRTHFTMLFREGKIHEYKIRLNRELTAYIKLAKAQLLISEANNLLKL